jgi:hypothetical protein
MRIKRLMVALFVAALLAAVVAGPASAQQQNGLVNVNISDIEIEDINVAVAANIVTQACGLDVDVVAGIIATIDAGDTKQVTFCRLEDGRVKVTQD